MSRKVVLFVTFFIVLKVCTATYDPIYKLYRDELENRQKTLCIDENRKEYKFIAKGLPIIFWETSLPLHLGIHSHCSADIVHLQSSMKNGSSKALKFLDASSSFPSGFLEGTLSNLGDFDECISTKYRSGNVSFKGKYFHFVTFLIDPCKKYQNVDITELVDMTEPGLPEMGLTMSVCLPSSCSNTDVFLIAKNGFQHYPFLLVMDDIHSDTQETISFSNKVKNLQTIQIVALIFITICISLVFTSLLLSNSVLKYFDPYDNTRDIFFVKKGEMRRSLFVDLNKTIVVLIAIVLHTVTCADSPRSVAYISHINFAKSLMRNIVIQVVTFEGGFNALAFLSGINTFEEVFPALQKNQANFTWFVLNKWLRYIPAFASLMSLELVWPLLVSGPLSSETGESHLEKTRKYWWTVFLYSTNVLPFAEQPIVHTNYSMIDFQLYFLGLLGVYLLYKNNRQGYIFASIMIFSGYTSLGLHVWLYNVQPHFIHPSALLRKVMENLRYIHFHFHTYLPTYFVGILMAYCVKGRGFHMKNRLLSFSMTILFYGIAVSHPLFLFYFKLVPDAWIPCYVISQKVFLAIGIIFNYLRDDCEEEMFKASKTRKGKVVERYNRDELRIEVALLKMSPAIYLVNYWFIKTDYYTKRDIFYTGTYQILTRIVYSFIFIYFIGYLFLICFLIPFDRIRKNFTKRPNDDMGVEKND